MTFEIKQCPYCGRWCHPKLVIATYNGVTPNVTTYEVVYPCICRMVIDEPEWGIRMSEKNGESE